MPGVTAVNKPARWPGPAQAGPTYGQGVTSCCEEQCLPLVWLAATLTPWAAGPVLRANISSFFSHTTCASAACCIAVAAQPPMMRPSCCRYCSSAACTSLHSTYRGLAGPDTSSSEDEEGSEEEAGSGSGSGSEEEDEEEGGSEEDEDADEDEKVFRQRRPVLPRRGTAEEEEEPLNEEDLEEWGVGALAANPEEPVRRGCAAGLWGGWAGAAGVAGLVGVFDGAAAAAAAAVVDA